MSRAILVVDDDRDMVKTLCAVLRHHGWQPEPAYAGDEAVRRVRDRAYAAVLMDVRMPGLNGVDAFRAIRRERPTVPVILMTAYAAHELLGQAQREGVAMILPKPLPLPRLTAALEEMARAGPVLLIDDEPEFLETLAKILSRSDHCVLKASTLEQALDFLTQTSPAIIVMDLKLDTLEPKAAVLAIKRVSPAVLLILYSGYPRLLDDTVAHLPSEWVYATLHKPFSPERLLQLLDEL